MSDDQRIKILDVRRRDFFMVDNIIIDHYAPIIGPFATLVYAALCRHADCSTHETHPSHQFLAKELGVSHATIKRAIQMLTKHRLIGRKHRKSRSGDPDTNIYIILELRGRVSRTLPQKDDSPDEIDVHEEVGSIRPEGGVSQTPGVGSIRTEVGSIRATNNTQLQEEKNTPPTPSKRGKRVPKSYEAYPVFCELFAMAVVRPNGDKGDKGETLKRWIQLNPNPEEDPTLAECILRAYAYQKTSLQWQEAGGKYVPQIQVWLGRKPWESVDVPDGFDRQGQAAKTKPRYQVGDLMPDGITRKGKIG